MVEVGDEIELSTKKVGQAPRTLSVVRPVGRKIAWTKPSTKAAESETAASRKRTTATKAAKVKRVSDGTSRRRSSGKERSR